MNSAVATAKNWRDAHELDKLRRLAPGRRLTLLFAAHDATHNNAAALREILLA